MFVRLIELRQRKQKKKEANKYGQGSGEGLANFPKAHYLLWEQEKIIIKKNKKTQRNRFCHKGTHTHTQMHNSRPDLDLKTAPCETIEGWVGCSRLLFLSPCEWANRKIRNLNMLLFEFSLVQFSSAQFFAATASHTYSYLCRCWRTHRYSPQSAAASDTFAQIQQHKVHAFIVWVGKCGSWRMLRYVLPFCCPTIYPSIFMITFYCFPQLRLTLWHLQLPFSCSWATDNWRQMLPRTLTFPKRFHHVSCISEVQGLCIYEIPLHSGHKFPF